MMNLILSSVIMLSVIMPSVIMLSVIMPSVMASWYAECKIIDKIGSWR
jgi:hypothetical protein